MNDLRVAITGGIACGKSLFARRLGQLGAEILDADDVTRALEAPGGAAVSPIRAAFGDRAVAPDGSIDRAWLALRVFECAAARERLNRIVHPKVLEEIERWLRGPACRPRAVVIPLLFEAGWQEAWDVIVCVVASEETQLARLTRDRGLTVEEARKRLSAQMPVAEKAARSHLVVNNDSDVVALTRAADNAYRRLWRGLNER